MKTCRIELSPEVEAEILQAARYINRNSPIHAKRWLDGIHDAIASLSSMPERCGMIRQNVDLAEDFRELLYKSHRVIFLVSDKTVRVVHVRHSARDRWKPEE